MGGAGNKKEEHVTRWRCDWDLKLYGCPQGKEVMTYERYGAD